MLPVNFYRKEMFSLSKLIDMLIVLAITTGKTLVAVKRISAVHRGMVKTALPCDEKAMHGKENTHGKDVSERTATNHSRQRKLPTHGKDTSHDKEGDERTAKRAATTKVPSIAVHPDYAV
jgi:hypothetical protein